MAATSQVSLSYPKNRSSQEKYIKVVRGDTTAFIGGWLPKGAIISGLYVLGSAASDAGTSANIFLGTTSAANQLVNNFNAIGNGTGYHAAGTAMPGRTDILAALTADTPLYAKYAEAGTASTVGGPWYFKVEYFVPGPGETGQM